MARSRPTNATRAYPAASKADEYRALQAAAHQMLDAADTAARQDDPVTEQRAEAAAGRLIDQARRHC